MRYQILFLFIILSFLIGCGGNTEPTKNTTNSTNTTVTNRANTNSPLSTTATPETAKTGEAPNLSKVVQGYYDALNKKDEAATKKFLSANALKYYETEAKSEKKTWFAYLLELEDPVNEKREVRNEKIEGEKADAEIKGGSLGKFTKVAFVKENGEWKFASQDENLKFSDIKKTDMPSNMAK